jgi:uncharacterized membrane protein
MMTDDSLLPAMGSVIEGLLPVLNVLSPLLVVAGAVIAVKGLFDSRVGYPGAGSRVVSGLMLAGLGGGLPVALRAFGPELGIEVPTAEETDKPGSDSRPSNDPTPTTDSTPDSTDTTGGDSPLDPAGFEVFLWVIGCIMAVVILIGLVAGGVAYARSRKRKTVEAREAAARARAEEEARLDRVWAEAVQRHDYVRDESMRHQTDIDLVLSMPVINDMSEPKTKAYIEALAQAVDLAHDTRPSSAEAVEAYAKATREAERAWGAAVRNADLVRLSKFSPEERKTIQQVAKLMKRAEHETTPAARKSYFEQATRILNNLIEIPTPAAEAIEQSIAGVLANPNAEDATTPTQPILTPTGARLLAGRARHALTKVTR